MKAIVITAHGGPEVLAVTELPDPVPAAGEILIRIQAFGLNHAETYMRNAGHQRGAGQHLAVLDRPCRTP